MSYSEVLAQHLAETKFADVPRSGILAAKRSLIDTLGVALAARGAPGMDGILQCCEAANDKGAATIWSNGLRTSATTAAFANGAHVAALDFDSLHTSSSVHADMIVVPVVLAIAERLNLTGESILLGVALGNDLICRLAGCTRENGGWFYSSLYGGMAAAAIAATLSGATDRTIANAIGLAFTNAGGTQQPASERTTAKRIQGALATLVGMTCADLAIAGLDGPKRVLEGSFGLFNMYERGDASQLDANLGILFEGENISYKLFPICQCSHAAVETVLRLRQRYRFTAREVTSIRVRVSAYMNRLVGSAFQPGAAAQIDAQFSLQYCIAQALFSGRLGIAEIQPSVVCDPKVLAIATKVRVEVDSGNSAKYVPIELTVHLADGRVFQETATDFSGSPTQPLDDEQIDGKFHLCLATAGAPRRLAQVLLDCLRHVEDGDAATLTSCVQACGRVAT